MARRQDYGAATELVCARSGVDNRLRHPKATGCPAVGQDSKALWLEQMATAPWRAFDLRGINARLGFSSSFDGNTYVRIVSHTYQGGQSSSQHAERTEQFHR